MVCDVVENGVLQFFDAVRHRFIEELLCVVVHHPKMQVYGIRVKPGAQRGRGVDEVRQHEPGGTGRVEADDEVEAVECLVAACLVGFGVVAASQAHNSSAKEEIEREARNFEHGTILSFLSSINRRGK